MLRDWTSYVGTSGIAPCWGGSCSNRIIFSLTDGPDGEGVLKRTSEMDEWIFWIYSRIVNIDCWYWSALYVIWIIHWVVISLFWFKTRWLSHFVEDFHLAIIGGSTTEIRQELVRVSSPLNLTRKTRVNQIFTVPDKVHNYLRFPPITSKKKHGFITYVYVISTQECNAFRDKSAISIIFVRNICLTYLRGSKRKNNELNKRNTNTAIGIAVSNWKIEINELKTYSRWWKTKTKKKTK